MYWTCCLEKLVEGCCVPFHRRSGVQARHTETSCCLGWSASVTGLLPRILEARRAKLKLTGLLPQKERNTGWHVDSRLEKSRSRARFWLAHSKPPAKIVAHSKLPFASLRQLSHPHHTHTHTHTQVSIFQSRIPLASRTRRDVTMPFHAIVNGHTASRITFDAIVCNVLVAISSNTRGSSIRTTTHPLARGGDGASVKLCSRLLVGAHAYTC